jgi:hypothetical protein
MLAISPLEGGAAMVRAEKREQQPPQSGLVALAGVEQLASRLVAHLG